MSTLLYAIVAGVTTRLDDATLSWREDEDGLGAAPLHRLTERGPMQHGDSDVGFRLDPRLFTISLGIQGTTEAEMYDKRAALLALFKPRNTPLSILYQLANGANRQIDCHYVDQATMPSSDRDGYYQRIVIALRASSPLWYDPALQLYTYAIGGGSQSMDVPLVIPWQMGASSINQTQTVTYAGTFQENPVIIIQGPVVDCKVVNQVTGEKLDFTGTTIGAGETYFIDTRYGYKTVTDQYGAIKIAALTDDSDLATFHLESAPDAPGGANSITVTGNAATLATIVYLRYYNRYFGF